MLPTGRRRRGESQPGIALGPFVIRIPLVHYQLEPSELLQGVIMTATGLGLVALLEKMFGIPYGVALTIIIVQQLGYFLHQCLGDTTISGWLTPAVPLILLFIARYPAGPERLQAYIALQLLMGVIFIALGTTGFATRLVGAIPDSLKAGLIVGAGYGVLTGEYGITASGLLFQEYRAVLIVAVPVIIFLIYSERISRYAVQHPDGIVAAVMRLGVIPGLVLAMAVAAVTGEVSFEPLRVGFFRPEFAVMVREWSVFAVGFPRPDMFLHALPLAFAAYVMAIGEVVLAEETAADAQAARRDERIAFNAGRLNTITGIRNLVHGLIAPNGGLAGPNWAAMTMVVARRYQQGSDAMYSLIGGAASFNVMRVTMMMFLPLVTLVTPFRVPILCVILVLQGFAGFSLGLTIADTRTKRAIAGLTGIVLVSYGVTPALVTGLVLDRLLVASRESKAKGR